MKKWFLIAAVFLSCSVVNATPDRIEILSSKVVLQNTNGYYVLSDRSCWKVIGFSKRWRSLSEWWNNVQIVPEHYDCVPNDWFIGTQIEIYPKYVRLDVNEANASNQEALKQCTHLLVNGTTGQILFAIALEPAYCIVQLFSEALDEGFNKGYSEGRSRSYQNATEVYNTGYSDGYKVGYSDGYKVGYPEGYENAFLGLPLN